VMRLSAAVSGSYYLWFWLKPEVDEVWKQWKKKWVENRGGN
jgi:hypothetical protein